MEQFENIQVIMLPIDDNPSILWDKANNELRLPFKNYNQSRFESQHLYFLSDEEIEKGDWCLLDRNVGQSTGYVVLQCVEADVENGEYTFKEDGNLFTTGRCEKIIATTDTSLYHRDFESNTNCDSLYPQPSQQFIEKYIESYNTGNPITEVLVEYEQIQDPILSFPSKLDIFKFKINPDNTINIREKKDSWNREEVIELLKKLVTDCNDNEELCTHYNGEYRELNNWIKENL